MSVFIGIEGYTLPCGFILKELCIFYPNKEFDHFLFKSPDLTLTEADKRTIRYTTENLNELQYEDGHIPYDQIGEILNSVKDLIIYTYSEVAVKNLQKYLPTTVIKNIQHDGFIMPKTLPESGCFRKHCQRYCGKAKSIQIKNFMGY